jgi:hypothetical protein
MRDGSTQRFFNLAGSDAEFNAPWKSGCSDWGLTFTP